MATTREIKKALDSKTRDLTDYAMVFKSSDGKSDKVVFQPPFVRLGKSNRRAMSGFGFAGSKKKVVPKLPPPISTTPTLGHVYRYTCATTGSYAITVVDLIGAGGMICHVVNSSAICVMEAVKVHRVTIWSALSTSSSFTPGVVWGLMGQDFAPDNEKSVVVPQGSTNVKPVSSTPPKGGLVLGNWLNNNGSAQVVFTLVNVSAGSVVDVHLSFEQLNNNSAVAVSVTATALGTNFYPALDGPASNKLIPTGLPTSH